MLMMKRDRMGKKSRVNGNTIYISPYGRKPMPSMPRIPGKGPKIAFKILGVPANIAAKKTKEQKFINRRLWFEETSRVR